MTFTPGALDHFAIGAITSPQTAGTAFSIGITAQDANNNTVPGFGGTVDLTTTAGTISPATSGVFSSGVLASQTVTVTGAGSGKTITATDHAGSGKSGTSAGFIVNPGVATQTRVETAADGSGTAVPAQDITAGNSNTVYAITRDVDGNFVGNPPATWSLVNLTGNVVTGDLVGGGASAVFTGHLVGSAQIQVVADGFTGQSGVQTVVTGAVAQTRVETAADGSGTVVPAQNVTAGASITVYAITRDAQGNFVGNPSADWLLANETGNVASGDLAAGGASATFTGHLLGSANIQAVAGGFTGQSGVQTVVAGAATQTRVETAADGSGTVVPAESVAAGNSITVYAITRDAQGNFAGNPSALWSLINLTGGAASGDLAPGSASAVFTGHRVGSAQIQAVVGAFTGQSGVQTVVAGTAAQVRVETAADGSGTVVPAQSVASGSAIAVYAVSRDGAGNFIGNVAADVGGWSLVNASGGVAGGDLLAAGDRKSAVFTGHVIGTAGIRAVAGGLTPVDSGTLTVVAGVAAQVRVETAANGAGTVVPAQSINSGSALTAYAVARDASGNFVTNVAASAWSLVNVTGGVVSGDLAPSGDSKSATFTAHVQGSAAIHAAAGSLKLDRFGHADGGGGDRHARERGNGR